MTDQALRRFAELNLHGNDLCVYYTDGSDQYYGVINAREKRPKMAFRAPAGARMAL
jgi:hypothetical protein